jgi:hypothetical protein
MRRSPTAPPAPSPRLLSSLPVFVRGAQTFGVESHPQTWPICPSMGLAPSQSPRCHLRLGLLCWNPLVQDWWAAGSAMLAQGSSACACAGGMQRGASAMAAAADTPVIALFIGGSFPDPPMEWTRRCGHRQSVAPWDGIGALNAPEAAPRAHIARRVEEPVGFTPARRCRRCTRARSRAGTG